MPAYKFDTLKIAKELEKARVPPLQAEAHTHVAFEIYSNIQDSVVTKEDINRVREDINTLRLATKEDKEHFDHEIHIIKEDIHVIKEDIHGLKKNMILLDKKIDALSLKLTIRLGSLIVAGVVALAAILKF